MQVTASTLVSSPEELCRTYQNCHEVLQELEQRHVQVYYNVDATKLDQFFFLEHITTNNKWHAILFQHPHLGVLNHIVVNTTTTNHNDNNNSVEVFQAQRHHVLLAHYFASAKECLVQPGGVIQVCLCGTQATTWRLEEAASRQGLVLLETHGTERPLHVWKCWNNIIYQQQWKSSSLNESDLSSPPTTASSWLEPLPAQKHYGAPRRYRNGRYGSRHSLGRYGYRHRRTHGDNFTGNFTDMNVTGSRHYIFTIRNDDNDDKKIDSNNTPVVAMEDRDSSSFPSTQEEGVRCGICNTWLEDESALQQHLQSPALPDPPLIEEEEAAIANINDDVDDDGSSGCDENSGSEDCTPAAVTAPQDQEDVNHESSDPDGQSDRIAAEHLLDRVKNPAHWEYSFAVTEEGMRVNDYLHQHVVTAGGRLSKQQAKRLVNAGRVFLNQQQVRDKSRILHANEHLVVMKEAFTASPSVETDVLPRQRTIDIVQELGDFVVVMKPRSMRAIGDFTPHTLERTFSREQGASYRCLSRMDSGCPGLCVLQRKENGAAPFRNIVVPLTQVYTVLVHGHVPEQWDRTSITAMLPSTRWWKNQKAKNRLATTAEGNQAMDPVVSSDEESDPPKQTMDDDDHQSALLSPMNIRCLERTKPDNFTPPLSTLRIATSCTSGGPCRRICSYLRGAGYPVVNDRKNQREYLCLPRSVRNRIKRKLCIGCYTVEMGCAEQLHNSMSTIIADVPDILRASFWQGHCESSTPSAQSG
jgi:hypothetical protein